jgi:hypothetical protein
VLANAADAGFMQGRISGQQYHDLLSIADPGALADGRRRVGYDQAAKGDLDGRPRDLDQDETGHVAGAAFMKRVGLAQDLPQQSESDDTPVQETASDWSASRMQKFVEQREREKSTDGPIPSDGVYHTPTGD